jgi:hypothetical protein
VPCSLAQAHSKFPQLNLTPTRISTNVTLSKALLSPSRAQSPNVSLKLEYYQGTRIFRPGMAGHGVQAVEDFGRLLEEMLEAASSIKRTNTIEPPLNKTDLAELFEQVSLVFSPTSSLESRKHIIETAARDAFNNLLVSRTSVRA